MKMSVPTILAVGVALVTLSGGALLFRAERQTSHKTLAAEPKGVTVVAVRKTSYRPSRRYVGAVTAWVEAKVGPQFISAYATKVGFRPGDEVKRGEVLAQLDCGHASAANEAVSLQAKAVEAEQQAIASEARRLKTLVEQGFVSVNEAEKKLADAEGQAAQLSSARAKMVSSTIERDDCVLRAPFAGEIGERFVDPGAFVRPGLPLLTLVDRRKVRIIVDAPENDFALVAPNAPVKVHLVATGEDLGGVIARRSPAAESNTRTVRFEIDLDNPDRRLPVGTSAEVALEIGAPVDALEVPLIAAGVRNARASLFVVEGEVARAKTLAVLGERAGRLYLDAGLADGARVVTEGRGALADGDRIAAHEDGGNGEPAPGAAPEQKAAP